MAVTRVLHVVSDPARRGAQTFATQLVASMSSDPDWEMEVVALSDVPDPSSGLGLPVLGRPHGHRTLIALRDGLRSSAVGVAHGSTTLRACAIVGPWAGTPWVYRNIGDPTVWGRVRGAQLRIGWPLRRASGVVALYEGSREYMIDRYGLDPDRVVTIPNAVPGFDEPTVSDRISARAELELADDVRWIAFVGSLSEEKRVLDAIDAVARDPELGLIVAGDGPLRAAAETMASRLAVDRIRFTGVTDRPLTVMAAAHVLVLPSRTEGIPGVAIEAGLSGIPVVATRVGGVPELVVEGRTGVLVDSRRSDELLSAIHVALDDADAMGRAARAHCEEGFTMERVAPQWAEFLQRIVDEHRR